MPQLYILESSFLFYDSKTSWIYGLNTNWCLFFFFGKKLKLCKMSVMDWFVQFFFFPVISETLIFDYCSKIRIIFILSSQIMPSGFIICHESLKTYNFKYLLLFSLSFLKINIIIMYIWFFSLVYIVWLLWENHSFFNSVYNCMHTIYSKKIMQK